jgi:regulator of protease activity HflC (stomatin/prohibitin superfamily)
VQYRGSHLDGAAGSPMHRRAPANTAWSLVEGNWLCWRRPVALNTTTRGGMSMEVALIIAVIAAIFVIRTIKIVPQQHAWVVERLGKFDRTLPPGLQLVVPFIERVAYKHSLKEVPLDVPSQVCITRDNTQLQVDGIIYFQITDPMRASYGSSNYVFAITQLAQTCCAR